MADAPDLEAAPGDASARPPVRREAAPARPRGRATALRLWPSGEYDADLEVVLEADGRFSIERGGYATAGRRYGTLARAQRADLERRVSAVDLGAEHAVAGSARTVLEVGGARVAWAGPPPSAELRALVGALVRL